MIEACKMHDLTILSSRTMNKANQEKLDIRNLMLETITKYSEKVRKTNTEVLKF